MRFELELKRLLTAVTTTVVLMRRRIIRKAKLSRRWEVEEEEKPVEGSVRNRLRLVKKRIRSSEADAEIKQHALLPTMLVKLVRYNLFSLSNLSRSVFCLTKG